MDRTMPQPQPLPPYNRPCHAVRVPSPTYTRELSPGEERISYTSFSRSPRTGQFTTGDLVTGTIQIQGSSESVTEVVLKLFGRLDLATSQGSHQNEIVKDSYTVWSNSTRLPCPTTLPFSFLSPSTFKDGENTWPLPPTIRITPSEKSFLYVKCTYTLSVIITTALGPRFVSWRGEKTLNVPLTFRPTASPPRPIFPDPNLLSNVKYAPDEWYQITCTTEQLKNVHCSLFIPSVLQYALSDSIPFHLQISGPAAMLSGFVRRPTCKTPVRVHLMRQLALFVRGEGQHRDMNIGNGVLTVLPPPISSTVELDEHEAVVDWSGVVQCDASVTVGTFDAGALCVKDFIVFSIPAWNVEQKHPIHLVTDMWVDNIGPGN
ncbi:hypothetical protein C8R43DRAFT_567787 [Mycena crocata]|nr:hypothetical protein C8R43DRAFT_567787 [Mycena crocata]